VWATDAAYVNDSTELKHGYDVVCNWLRIRSTNGEADERKLAERTLSTLENGRGLANVHLFCLTENRDQLSQWRAYSGGGSGYAIGFDSRVLLATPPKLEEIGGMGNYLAGHTHDARVEHVLPVIYDPIEQARIIEAQFKIAVAAMRDPTIKHGFIGNIQSSALMLGLALVDDVIMFKNPAFREEAEWRAVFLRFDELSKIPLAFRLHKGTLIPYVCLALTPTGTPDKLPLVEVVRGPQSGGMLGSKALRSLLRQCGYTESGIITESAIPLR
jgi:hypothetical protein